MVDKVKESELFAGLVQDLRGLLRLGQVHDGEGGVVEAGEGEGHGRGAVGALLDVVWCGPVVGEGGWGGGVGRLAKRSGWFKDVDVQPAHVLRGTST